MSRTTLVVWRFALPGWLLVLSFGLVVLASPPEFLKDSISRQKKDKKRAEDEEDPPAKKSGPGKKRTEDEDGGVTRVDDPDDKPAGAKPKIASDLGQAARETRHPRAKKLLQILSIAYDEIDIKPASVTRDGSKIEGKLRISPLEEHLDDQKGNKNPLEIELIDDSGKTIRKERISRSRIQAVRYHEQIAVEMVREFLEQPFDRYDPSNVLYLGKLDQILVGETALSGVLQMHQSARDREARKGPSWDKLETALREELLKVKLSQLEQLVDNRSWDAAFDLTRSLMSTFDRPKEHAQIAVPLGKLLEKAIKDPEYTQDRLKEVRKRLRQVEDQFPGSDLVKPINASLKDQATALFERAKSLVKEKKLAEATDLLRQAKETWPDLPGLLTYQSQLEGTYQILKVGMRQLPLYMSPGLAVTDAECRTSELMFESLVRLLPDGSGTLSYRPALAEESPRVVSLGRQFKLPKQAKWSDGLPLTIGDVRFTVQMIKDGQASERGPAWWGLLDDKRPIYVEDPFRFQLRLRHGYIHPLAVMSFKVLPQRSRPHPSDKDFARKPIGSGPFRLAKEGSDGGRTYTRFEANPHYTARPNSGGNPHIRELRIYAPSNPVNDLKEDRLDMLTDLTPAQTLELQEADGVDILWPGEKTSNRRIYFLAINHRKQHLFGNAELRIAIARAINREALLNDYFRNEKFAHKVHRALNGPYPAGSWACNPVLNPKDGGSLDPYDAELARTKLRQALTKLGKKEISLVLKYPEGDKSLAAALEQLCLQVKKALPEVTIRLQARTPYDLHDDVEQTFSYELAYYHYDFPDEGYWLQPLLGVPARDGGDNILGYRGSIVRNIQKSTELRDFAEVRKYAHAIHRQVLEEEMPLIPLWQLDPLTAVRRGRIQMVDFDPQLLFTRAEEWRVRTGQ